MAIEGLQHILCPVDFSELSGLALRYADAFARCGGAALTVLYANPFLPPPHVDSAQMAELEEQFRKWHAEAASKLRTFVNNTLGADAASVQTAVVEALPVDGIRAAARQLDASLVVVGTHGRSGVNRLMMGSVAERILRESPVPVLTVRGDSLAPGETLRLRHVLCAVDNSGASRRALAWVSRMARCFGSQVTVLHVRQRETPGQAASNAIEDLPAWVPASMRRECTLECVVREGEPAHEIVALARELETGMLVMGTQHRLFHGVSVIGNTTAIAVRHAPCPVLTVIGPSTVES
jgi:nucleotide-binding universal stress UspA family protein